ncbi:DnaJ domain-containing protein [Urinicoccus massiliensis]|uniref:DnaJ domain-containing protein n=1 Tax=Urinicoccus massiliensis TaxID=1723382 RepID=UPI00093049D2|nr:DnaJ domain-containing protein [Urinicoccus massiliensis]
MNKFLGHVNQGIGVFVDYLLSALITVVSILVNIFGSLKDLLTAALTFGGCFLFLVFSNVLMFSRYSFIFLLIFVFPFIGKVAVSYLKYLQYMVTEYFYEKADFYLQGKDASFDSMGDYGRRYKRMQEQERIRQEQEWMRQEQTRRAAQEEAYRRQWEEFARSFGDQFTYGYGNRESYGGYQGAGQGGPGSLGFVDQYEKAAGVLGISPLADKYEVKLAYRKLAKKYHPDINKDPSATKKFQEINDAYEFMNEDNMNRYRQMKKG